MKILISALFLVTSSIVAGQRPSFAGFRPIGFPDLPNRTTTTPDPLGNRSQVPPEDTRCLLNIHSDERILDPYSHNLPQYGTSDDECDDDTNCFGEGTTERLPIEANGDRDLIDRLSKLPIDKQPFWFINWQAYEKHRQDPQTYPQRPNPFLDSVPLNANFSSANNGFSTPSTGLVGTNPSVLNRFGPTTTTRTTSQLNSNFVSSSNFNNNNSNFNPGGNNYPNSNVNLNPNVYPSGNNANYVYPTANPNLNVNPTANPNFNTYPNSNFNNYPATNTNNYPTSNTNNYPSVNPNNYPSVIPNNYPSVIPNNYPSSNTNNYPSSNTNTYPTGNFNNYPTDSSNTSGNSNTNVVQTSNFNTQSNTGTTKDGITYYQTAHNYKWNTSWTTKVGPTNVSKYPEYYPRTDTYPKTSARVVL